MGFAIRDRHLHRAGRSPAAGAALLLPALLAASAAMAQPEPLPADAAAAPAPSAEAELVAADLGAGMASYYGSELSGNRTASGEAFDPDGMTAAHRTLPFGSRVRVTSVATGRSVIVRINDRGPFHGNRLIDISIAAAREIGLAGRGSGTVRLALLSR